ncbi:MAG: M1 family metallopeptidase [Gemmatimonadota bacterium]
MKSMRTAWLAGAAAAALSFSAGCARDLRPPLDEGIPRALARYRASTLSEISYEISLSIPQARGAPVEGHTVLRFLWRDRRRSPVVVDFKDPGERVSRVAVNGVEISDWEGVNDHIVLPASAFAEGANRVELWYRAGDEALNRSDDFLYTLFVPDRAHFSLPVFDQPDLKAPVTWELETPRSWRVVANAPSVESTTLNGRTTTRFLPTKPLPTYLFAFAAGKFKQDFQVVEDRVLRMFHRETDTAKVERNREAVFRLHGRALRFLEDYTDLPYPFQKFEFVLIPAFQYGGMEHVGAILYRQAGLLLDETATENQLLGRASVIAHETAHMWFGDLVTMKWFNDVWTKEVFANFMAAKIVEPSFPQVNHRLRFLMAHHPAAYAVDRTRGANPIRQPLENLKEAGTLYGAIIYQKAPIVMRQLEDRMGAEAFRDGLREYLKTFSYANATWPDLVAILDRRSDEDLQAWSRVWVEEAGRPRVRVMREGDDLVVSQEDPWGKGRVWPQRLTFFLQRTGGEEEVRVDLGKDAVRIEGGARDLVFALPNASGLEYGEFVLDSLSRGYLEENVSTLRGDLIRGAAWVTLWEDVLFGRLAPQSFLDQATLALGRESVELNLNRVLGYTREAFWRLSTPEERLRRAPALEEALWAGATGALPRTARSAFLSAYRDVALTPEGVERLRRLWEGKLAVRDLPLSEGDRIALARALALRVPGDAEAILDAQEASIRNPDRLARFRFARPSLSPDPAERERFFESLKDPANREHEPWVLDGLRNLNHPLRSPGSLRFVRPALDMVEEIQRTGDIFFPGRWLDATLGGHNEPEAAEAVEAFLAASPDLPARLRGKVLQSADMVFRGARIVYGWENPEG